MTATKVDGHAVIAVEPVESPLSTTERPVSYTRIVRLLLDDDTEIFGCAAEDACEFTASAVGQVRHHVGRSHFKGSVVGHVDARILDITIGELLSLAETNGGVGAALERMTADRNEWKARARKAESAMATLKKVLA